MGLSKKKNLSPLPMQTLGDAHFATTQEVAAAGLLGEGGIRLGYYRDPESRGEDWGKVIRYSGDAHLITVAPTGSGKGRDVLVGALLEYEGSCIVIDPKGQLAAITRAQRERMGQKVIVLNPLPQELPMDLGPSAKYNPMACLDPNSDAFGPNCEAIADSIVMHEDGPNSHFADSARQLIAGIIMHLAAHGRDGEKNLVMMQRIVSGPIKALEGFIAEAMASDREGFISGMLARFANIGGEDRELRSIISTAITQCGFINNKAIGASLSASDFSFRDLKRDATTVYLVLPAKYIQTCGKWFRLVLASAIAELWSDERGKYPILAIIDEFKQLGRLAVIADAMGMARGFGLQLWPILQDLTQLKENYGDQWETFLGGAAVRQFFGPRENFTAEYVSKLCGVKTVVAEGQSVQHARELFQRDQTGESWGQHAQPLLHPHNVSALGPEESLVLGPQNIVIDAFRKPYFETEELAALASPDPYHKQDAEAPLGASPREAPSANFADREWAAAQGMAGGARKRRPGVLNRLFSLLHGKPGWALLGVLTFVPLAVCYEVKTTFLDQVFGKNGAKARVDDIIMERAARLAESDFQVALRTGRRADPVIPRSVFIQARADETRRMLVEALNQYEDGILAARKDETGKPVKGDGSPWVMHWANLYNTQLPVIHPVNIVKTVFWLWPGAVYHRIRGDKDSSGTKMTFHDTLEAWVGIAGKVNTMDTELPKLSGLERATLTIPDEVTAPNGTERKPEVVTFQSVLEKDIFPAHEVDTALEDIPAFFLSETHASIIHAMATKGYSKKLAIPSFGVIGKDKKFHCVVDNNREVAHITGTHQGKSYELVLVQMERSEGYGQLALVLKSDMESKDKVRVKHEVAGRWVSPFQPCFFSS
jgi:type IV secretion system protein VirD4